MRADNCDDELLPCYINKSASPAMSFAAYAAQYCCNKLRCNFSASNYSSDIYIHF